MPSALAGQKRALYTLEQNLQSLNSEALRRSLHFTSQDFHWAVVRLNGCQGKGSNIRTTSMLVCTCLLSSLPYGAVWFLSHFELEVMAHYFSI